MKPSKKVIKGRDYGASEDLFPDIGTWDLVLLPVGRSPVDCYWVYTIKIGSDSRVDCLKAHLIAKGYIQIYGSYYYDTFPLLLR